VDYAETIIELIATKKKEGDRQNGISCSSRRMLVSGWKKACLFILAAGGLDLQNEWQSAN